jgi:c-di-GMP-binding flagellar brake protein YcgR
MLQASTLPSSWEAHRMERTRRKYPRRKIYLPVECASAGNKQSTHAWTLGGGGMFLAILDKMPVGTELAVRFRPAPHLPVVEAKAQVRYQVPEEGVAIEFTDINPEYRDMILLLIGQRMAEKRRFLRAPLVVQVEQEEGIAIGMSREISAGGMFIETETAVSAYSDLRLRFHLEDDDPIIKVAVEVRYAVGNHGIGVRFTEISPADRNRIDAYVNRDQPGL